MQTMQWKPRRLFGLAIIIFVSYFVLRVKNYTFYASVVLDKIHPNEAWEYVADFSNMKNLNPTIGDFNIIGESGNYDHWKYSAEYWENLSHWPHFQNSAVAHFDVIGNPKRGVYTISSIHTTCFFAGTFCLESSSKFQFRQTNSTSVLCEEFVRYQCPMLLSAFCEREVAFQRNAIMSNLKMHFNQL